MQVQGGAAEWVIAAQATMPAGECAPHVAAATRGGVCFSQDGVRALAAATQQPLDDPAVVVDRAKAATGCGSQVCLLSRALNNDSSERDRFKPEGPVSTRKWLDNNNIDRSCKQWTQQFPEHHSVPFAMMNFMHYDNSLRNFNVADAYRGGKRTFSCVLNTDHYPGRGKHWVCLFGDWRGGEGTIEYFNSSGRPPPPECVQWMVRAREAMKRAGKKTIDVVVARRPHQQGDSECGVYCLFYIWSRLNGVSWQQFANHTVPDADVFQFRARLFNSAN